MVAPNSEPRRKSGAKLTATIKARIEPDLRNRVECYARRHERDLSYVLRKALLMFLNQEDQSVV